MLIAYSLELSHDPAHIRDYEAYHANPYPEVAQHWRDIGVRSAHIFRLGYRLIMLIERVSVLSFYPLKTFSSLENARAWISANA